MFADKVRLVKLFTAGLALSTHKVSADMTISEEMKLTPTRICIGNDTYRHI